MRLSECQDRKLDWRRSIFKRCPVLDRLYLSLWHYYSGEDSKKIYKQAAVEVMKRNYMMFHTMDPVLAIEDLKEIYNQKR